MRRFDDVLRMLSSILLGIMVKDFYQMSKNLSVFCNCDPDNHNEHPLAVVAVMLLLIVFLRNIHGSARYDDYLQKNDCSARFERYVSGRYFSGLLSIVALFFGPSLAGYWLVHNLTPTDSASSLLSVMFAPFAIYFVWDFALWLGRVEKVDGDGSVKRHLEDVIGNWMKVNALGMLLLGAFSAYWWIVKGADENFLRLTVAGAFIVIAGTMVVADYYANRLFYFPPPNQTTAKGGPESSVGVS